jgi:hypothetical protein
MALVNLASVIVSLVRLFPVPAILVTTERLPRSLRGTLPHGSPVKRSPDQVQPNYQRQTLCILSDRLGFLWCGEASECICITFQVVTRRRMREVASDTAAPLAG